MKYSTHSASSSHGESEKISTKQKKPKISDLFPSLKMGGKRKSVEDETENDATSPQKKKKVCPYGSSCYRKKEGHFEEYEHNEETSSTVQSNTTATSNEEKSKKEILPDLFTSLTFHIHSSVKDKEKLRRYIIACDGDV